MKSLTYYDFALDEYKYLASAYMKGLRFNAMVSQAQRITELLLKQVIAKELLNNEDIMTVHNLRKLYDYLMDTVGFELTPIRSSIMLLNNFYNHTRYPGKEAFMAREQDIKDAFEAVTDVLRFLQKETLHGTTGVFMERNKT